MKTKQFQQATQTAKFTPLPGRWSKVDQWGHMVGDFVALRGQNGFWAVHKISSAGVFVVTTGPHKGIWTEVSY